MKRCGGRYAVSVIRSFNPDGMLRGWDNVKKGDVPKMCTGCGTKLKFIFDEEHSWFDAGNGCKNTTKTHMLRCPNVPTNGFVRWFKEFVSMFGYPIEPHLYDSHMKQDYYK